MEDFEKFINRFSQQLYHLFHRDGNINDLSLNRGLPKKIWEQIMSQHPLSVAIPQNYGGRGMYAQECLRLLAAASYESLPLSLTFGINIALFLEPLAKYGCPELQAPVFERFMHHQAMGGLMITEPDYGSDALNMRTSYTETPEGYHLKGQKHWQGLTGMADFWIVAARKQLASGNLGRDIEFFLTDQRQPSQQIKVKQYYNNLGLYMIPYGLNIIDVTVAGHQQLKPQSTGIKMMLDILHRSRTQFPGMGMGFIQRMLDEALTHCQQRKVAGQPLIAMDSVRYQLSRIQSSFTLCSGMCARSAAISGIENDLSGAGLEANSMKALVTDTMQEAAQICVQLSGSSGYKIDHIAGRGIVDSRPFQIFEGSNEMLYTQIAETVVKEMKKRKELHVYRFLQGFVYTDRIDSLFAKSLDFSLPPVLVQRQMVVLGKIIARLICLQYVIQMSDKGFRKDLLIQCTQHVQTDIKTLSSDLLEHNVAEPIVEYQEKSHWSDFV